MTHFQEIFIKNLRFFRKKKGISQLAFSEMIDISPNYLNAVENGKNFPSPEVIQAISDALEVFPFQLFLEKPLEMKAKDPHEKELMVQELVQIKGKLNKVIDDTIQKYN
ncbi:helix-turn-helix domain-containing protein [Treponema primitia]|uniref:helix-turn-helix domain-containing protein n=1 Tax=Treponema primitia TaxID=88058 RepID=UPI0039812DB3